MKLRTALLGISALFIASAAAYFSVTGLSKLFAGASTAVILMASSLEFGKLVSAGFLYNYWDRINKILRVYLLAGVMVLILITSAGIYGFLTSAYQETADELKVVNKELKINDLKIERLQNKLDGYTKEKKELTSSISELSNGLSNNTIQYKDKESGKIITTTSSSTRRALERQLDDAKSQRDKVSNKIEEVSDSISSLEIQSINTQQSSDVAGEVGPLKFIAETTGKSMNSIVNWFALFIVFVFDPLAVTLVVAFNTALKIDKGEGDKKDVIEKRELYGESTSNIKHGEITNDTKYNNTDDNIDSTDETSNESKNNLNDNTDLDESDDKTRTDENKVIKSHPKMIKEDFSNIDEKDNNNLSEDMNDWDSTLNDGLDEHPFDYESTQENTTPKTESPTEIKRDTTRRGIDLDGDGKVDGYDTNGDGLIDEPAPSSSKRAQYTKYQVPYYARGDFDWSDKSKWINNQNAVNYWLTHIKNQKDNTRYPDNFDSKTY